METCAFLDSVWHLENARPAFQINLPVDSGTTMLERFDNPHKLLEHHRQEAREHVGIRDDYLPILPTYLGTGVFPSAFGCPIHWFENADPWASPVIDTDASAVYTLKQPSVIDGLLGRVLDLTRFMANSAQVGAPPDPSAPLRVRVTDVQGPLDVAYLVWRSEDFMMALYEHPDEVHALMRLCTRLIIDFVREQRRLVHELGAEFVPCHYPYIWMPDGAGVAVSDDCAALLSPRQYAEFALPYLNELSEALGGVFVHSCGDFTHNLPNLERVHGLRGIDFAVAEQPFEPVAERFAGRCVLSVRLGLDKDRKFESIPAWVEHVVRAAPTPRGLYLSINTWYSSPSSGRPWRTDDLEAIYDLIDV
jgi:uroporphyrinogen-III decarboxylase